jgi:hypothetical protein
MVGNQTPLLDKKSHEVTMPRGVDIENHLSNLANHLQLLSKAYFGNIIGSGMS